MDIGLDAGDLFLRLLIELKVLVLEHVWVQEFFQLLYRSVVLPALLTTKLLD